MRDLYNQTRLTSSEPQFEGHALLREMGCVDIYVGSEGEGCLFSKRARESYIVLQLGASLSSILFQIYCSLFLFRSGLCVWRIRARDF